MEAEHEQRTPRNHRVAPIVERNGGKQEAFTLSPGTHAPRYQTAMCCVSQSLRDNCWKARDDSARLQKESEDKLEQVYRDTEVYTNEHLKPLCARTCARVHACVTWVTKYLHTCILSTLA